jgi:integrase
VTVLRLFEPAGAMDAAPDDPTISYVIRLFLESAAARVALGTLKARSLARISETLDDFAAAMGGRIVRDCKNADLVSWIVAHPQWVSPHTKVTRMGQVVTAFRWADDEGHIERCPFKRKSKLWPRLEPRAAILPVEYERMMSLARNCKSVAVAGPRYKHARFYTASRRAFRSALYFLWETGARVGEMRCLEWKDVDLENGVAILHEHKTRQATGQARLIALPAGVLRLLRWRFRRQRPRPNQLVFPNGRGQLWKSSFVKTFRRYARLAGVRDEVSAYSLRHGFVVRLLEAGTGQRQIADVIGHTSTRYIEWYGRTARQNIEYLQKILADAKRRRD